MIQMMENLPGNVLGFTVIGKITGTDYENVLIPAIEAKLKTHPKIRLIYHLGKEFTGYDLSAMIDDTKVGIKHWKSWDKIALVSDHKVIDTIAKLFGSMMSCDLKVYPDQKLNDAISWVSEP